jgi:hypothetical protein
LDSEHNSGRGTSVIPSLIETIAQESQASLEKVTALFESASAKLESTARIKTFIGILAAREVRQQLKAQT